MTPRVNDSAISQSTNPIVIDASLRMACETAIQPFATIAITAPRSTGKRPLIERRRNRWSRRQW